METLATKSCTACRAANPPGEESHCAYAHLLLAGVAAAQQLDPARRHAQAAADLARDLAMQPLQARSERFLSELPATRPASAAS